MAAMEPSHLPVAAHLASSSLPAALPFIDGATRCCSFSPGADTPVQQLLLPPPPRATPPLRFTIHKLDASPMVSSEKKEMLEESTTIKARISDLQNELHKRMRNNCINISSIWISHPMQH